MKKIIMITILMFIAGMTIYVGCSQSQSARPQTAGGPVRLTVATTESLRVQDIKNQSMTRLIEQGTNTNLDFVLFPDVDYTVRLNLMVMAGGRELPDIILATPNDAMVYQWGREGAILPLKRYYDNPSLTPNIRDAITRAGYNFVPEITSPDGEIYGIARLSQTRSGELPWRFHYYKPWVDKLNLKVPTTPEEVRTFLRAIVTGDPNGNGRPDEIGMVGTLSRLNGVSGWDYWFRFLMNPFELVGLQLLNVNNGVISVPYNTEGWRAGLKYIRSLFAEGLLPIENLTQDDNAVAALLNSDPIRVGSGHNTSMWPITSIDTRAEYIAASPLIGANGRQWGTLNPSIASIGFMISANCQNPEAAFSVGDFMMKEEISITNRYGERGSDWDYVSDVPDALTRFVGWFPSAPPRIILYDDTARGGISMLRGGWGSPGPGSLLITYDIIVGLLVPPKDLALYGQGMLISSNPDYRPTEFIRKLMYTENENTIVSDIQATLDAYVLEMTAGFLAGNRDIDATWNAYIAELNRIGLARYLSTVQTAYNRMR